MSWWALGTPAVGGFHKSRDGRKIDDNLAAHTYRRNLRIRSGYGACRMCSKFSTMSPTGLSGVQRDNSPWHHGRNHLIRMELHRALHNQNHCRGSSQPPVLGLLLPITPKGGPKGTGHFSSLHIERLLNSEIFIFLFKF